MKTEIYKVFLAIALAEITEGTLMKKPLGIKMCVRACQCLKGCYSIQFHTVSLQCTLLTDPKDKQKDSPSVINRTVQRSKDPQCLLLSCSEGERSDQLVSVPNEESSVVVNDASSSILIVPYNDNVTAAFKMDLITKEIQPLPFFWKRVTQLVTVPREEKYLIAFRGRVISSPMSRRRDTQILQGMNIHTMVLDGKRSLVFLCWESLRKKYAEVDRINTDGRKKRFLLNSAYPPKLLEIDPNEEKVYFMSEEKFARINYDGKDFKVLDYNYYDLNGIGYLPSKGELYMQNCFTDELLRERFRENDERKVVGKVETIRSTVLFSSVLYFSGNSKDKVSSIKIDEKDPIVVTYPLPKTDVSVVWLLFNLPAKRKQSR